MSILASGKSTCFFNVMGGNGLSLSGPGGGIKMRASKEQRRECMKKSLFKASIGKIVRMAQHRIT